MKASPDLQRWRYYFADLPLWACGMRTSCLERSLFKFFEPEIPSLRDGIVTLYDYLGRSTSEADIEDVIRKTFQVKVVRESDAYTSLLMSKKKLTRHFHVEGLENLSSVADGQCPVVLLTGHYGSFFIPAIAFSHLGFTVYPIARTVDTSSATPLPTQYYLKLNYRLSELRFSSRYIYTDFTGKINRDIISIAGRGGIFWTAVDLPRRLYPHRHLPVKLFGRPATLPSGFIRWAVKKSAIFLTAWNSVEVSSGGEYYRRLTIDKPVPDNSTASSVLQAYADRLSDRVARDPWQWMGLQIISQFYEGEIVQDVG